MISRRSVLLSGSAAALSGMLGHAQSQRAVPAIRYNSASPQGKAMLRIYAEGVAAMRALPARDPRSWTFQWFLHSTSQPKPQSLEQVFPDGLGEAFELANLMWSTCQAHEGQASDYFLQFEAIIRAITARNEFALPYWDYTSASSYAIPEEFQLRSRAHPVFSSLFVPRRNSDGGRLRSANVNAGEPINKHYRGRRNFLVLPNLRQRNYSSFCQQLDSQLHDQVHQFVGDETNMGGVPSAAGDPLFWLHHCNIDRIWFTWNAAGGRNPTSTGGVDWAATRFSFVSAEGDRVDLPISLISDSATLPYRYDALPAAEASVSAVASLTPAGSVLLRSERAGQATVTSDAERRAQPIELGWAPVRSVLAPTSAQNRLLSVAAELTPASGNLVLSLQSVQAQLDPGTAYQVFLDLPANASDEVLDQHYVGMIVFFGVRRGDARGPDGGRDFEFDVTDLVKTLAARSALKVETSVTIAPVGAPAASAKPVISGGIDLLRR
jgi:tyrosinase